MTRLTHEISRHTTLFFLDAGRPLPEELFKNSSARGPKSLCWEGAIEEVLGVGPVDDAESAAAYVGLGPLFAVDEVPEAADDDGNGFDGSATGEAVTVPALACDARWC
jgi:hypothetical protein